MAEGKFANPETRRMFLEELSRCGNVSQAAAHVGVSRTTVYKLRQEDEAFAKQWAEAEALGAAALEDEARRRAHDGIDKPIVWQGEIMHDKVVDPATGEEKLVPRTVKEYDNGLLFKLLAAHFPDKYKRREAIEQSGPGGAPIPHEIVVKFV